MIQILSAATIHFNSQVERMAVGKMKKCTKTKKISRALAGERADTM